MLAVLLALGLVSPTAGATAAGFDPADLCPSPTPTAADVAAVANRLSATMLDKAGRTGVVVREDSVPDWVRHRTWTFHADPTRERVAVTYDRVDDDGDGSPWVVVRRSSYADLRADLAYRRLSSADRTTTTGERDALRRLWKKPPVYEEQDEFLWLRTVDRTASTWPYPGYLDVVDDVGGRFVREAGAGPLACSVSGSTLTVTGTAGGNARRLVVTVDAEGAPLTLDLNDVEQTGEPSQWWASVTYTRPSLHRPLVSYNRDQFRKLSVGGAALRLRDDVTFMAGPAVAKASSHAKRVATLRRLSRETNARFLKLYRKDPSAPVKDSAGTVRNGKKYTIRIGSKAVATVTFTVVGRKIHTRTRVPDRPLGSALQFTPANSVVGVTGTSGVGSPSRP